MKLKLELFQIMIDISKSFYIIPNIKKVKSINWYSSFNNAYHRVALWTCCLINLIFSKLEICKCHFLFPSSNIWHLSFRRAWGQWWWKRKPRKWWNKIVNWQSDSMKDFHTNHINCLISLNLTCEYPGATEFKMCNIKFNTPFPEFLREWANIWVLSCTCQI